MRTSILIVLATAGALAASGCSGNNTRPAQVRNYGPEAGRAPAVPAPPSAGRWADPAQPPYVPQAPTYPQPATAGTGALVWHEDLAAAQAEARSGGRLILAMSTRPSCGMCKKFQNDIVPQVNAEVSHMAVGFIYDITPPVRDPGAAHVDRTLRANLRGADLLPLVGFLTPELQWVHGFWGARTTGQFRGDIARAQQIYPVSAAAVRRTAPEGVLTSVINEYGEEEWSTPGDVWPATDPDPIDAITGAPAANPDMPVARQPATLADATPPAPAPMPPGPPARTRAALPPPAPAPMPPASAPMPPAPRAILAPVAAAPAAGPAPVAATPDLRSPSSPPEADTTSEAVHDDGTWARATLRTALDAIRGGRFDAARSSLASIPQRMPESTYAREAARGRVALYNARKIRGAASDGERARHLARAQRDLGDTMWAELFRG